ncbi:MAG: hypothetical protein ACFFCY_00730 [Promethearchaeota archaeon]|jgi:hypothetical protein
MAVTEVKNNININISKVEFICPVCKSKKLLEVPKSAITEAKQLTTMSIAKGLVCEHQFQAFVDKQFQVRGYQRVDFEFESKSNQEVNSNSKILKHTDDELFENLILEGNYIEYKPKISKNNEKKSKKIQSIRSQKRKMTIKEIYNEFWEFIDDNNETFRDLIEKDLRRSHISLIY